MVPLARLLTSMPLMDHVPSEAAVVVDAVRGIGPVRRHHRNRRTRLRRARDGRGRGVAGVDRVGHRLDGNARSHRVLRRRLVHRVLLPAVSVAVTLYVIVPSVRH